MHSIKIISERNKIDAQSRADAYIRRKRLISKSDYNLIYIYLFTARRPRVFLQFFYWLLYIKKNTVHTKQAAA